MNLRSPKGLHGSEPGLALPCPSSTSGAWVLI